MPTTPVVTDWGTAVMSSIAAALALLLAGIPKIIGFLVILIIGWLIASAMATAVAALLRAVRFNDLAQRAGLGGFVRNMGVHTDAAGLLANLAKWFVRLIVLVTAFDALGLPAVSQVLQQLLLWLPNLVVALVVLVIGGVAANALAGLVRGATAESGPGRATSTFQALDPEPRPQSQPPTAGRGTPADRAARMRSLKWARNLPSGDRRQRSRDLARNDRLSRMSTSTPAAKT